MLDLCTHEECAKRRLIDFEKWIVVPQMCINNCVKFLLHLAYRPSELLKPHPRVTFFG